MLLDRTRPRFSKTRATLAATALIASAFVLTKTPPLLAFSTASPDPQVSLLPLLAPPAPEPPAAVELAKPKPVRRLIAQAAPAPQPAPEPASEPAPTPQSTPPPSVAPSQPLNIVVVIVQVTNPDGSFVPGLSSSSFQVLEDGVPQTISHFAQGDAAYYLGYIKPSRNTYGYYIGQPAKSDENYARIRVIVDRPNLIIRTRDGYSTVPHYDTCWTEIQQILRLPDYSRCD